MHVFQRLLQRNSYWKHQGYTFGTGIPPLPGQEAPMSMPFLPGVWAFWGFQEAEEGLLPDNSQQDKLETPGSHQPLSNRPPRTAQEVLSRARKMTQRIQGFLESGRPDLLGCRFGEFGCNSPTNIKDSLRIGHRSSPKHFDPISNPCGASFQLA